LKGQRDVISICNISATMGKQAAKDFTQGRDHEMSGADGAEESSGLNPNRPEFRSPALDSQKTVWHHEKPKTHPRTYKETSRS